MQPLLRVSFYPFDRVLRSSATSRNFVLADHVVQADVVSTTVSAVRTPLYIFHGCSNLLRHFALSSRPAMGRRSPDPEAGASSTNIKRSASPGKPHAFLAHIVALPRLLLKRVNRLSWPARTSAYLGLIWFLYLCYSRHARLNLLYNLTGIGQNHEDTNVNWPPRYEDVREWQRKLPQHNLSLPYPEGESGRYVRFSSQIRGLGWNNVFNEL